MLQSRYVNSDPTRRALGRRHLLFASVILPFALLTSRRTAATESKTLRVGFQKGEPVLMASRANGGLENALAPKGYGVEWIEFQFGPPHAGGNARRQHRHRRRR